MNLAHAPVECLPQDHYAGEFIDQLDELKVNYDEKMVAAESGAVAVGRKSDEIILDALDATTNPNNVAVAQIWSTAAGPIAFMEAMGAADVPVGDAKGLTNGDAISITTPPGSHSRRALDVGHCGSNIGRSGASPRGTGELA
jgi:hypothetical protein